MIVCVIFDLLNSPQVAVRFSMKYLCSKFKLSNYQKYIEYFKKNEGHSYSFYFLSVPEVGFIEKTVFWAECRFLSNIIIEFYNGDDKYSVESLSFILVILANRQGNAQDNSSEWDLGNSFFSEICMSHLPSKNAPSSITICLALMSPNR